MCSVFFKQKTAYAVRISDWSSDVCSSDLQLQWYLDDVNVQIDCYGRHNRYIVPFAAISPRVALPSSIPPAIYEIMVKAGMDPAEYEGRVSDIRRDVQLFKRKHGLEQGKEIGRASGRDRVWQYGKIPVGAA